MSNTRNRHALFVAVAALLLCAVMSLVQQVMLAPVWEGLAEAQQPVTVTNVAVDPCADPALVQNIGVWSAGTAAREELVAASGVQRIWLCSVSMQPSAVGDISLYFGTTPNCTIAQALIHKVTITAALEPLDFHSGGGSATAARSMTGHAFCYERHSAFVVNGHFRYVRQ